MVQVLVVEIVHDLPDVHVPMGRRSELEAERPPGFQHELVHLNIVDVVVLSQATTHDLSEGIAGERTRRKAALGRAVAPEHDQSDEQSETTDEHRVAVAEQLSDEDDDDRDGNRDLTGLVQARREQVIHGTLTQWAKPS